MEEKIGFIAFEIRILQILLGFEIFSGCASWQLTKYLGMY